MKQVSILLVCGLVLIGCNSAESEPPIELPDDAANVAFRTIDTWLHELQTGIPEMEYRIEDFRLSEFATPYGIPADQRANSNRWCVKVEYTFYNPKYGDYTDSRTLLLTRTDEGWVSEWPKKVLGYSHWDICLLMYQVITEIE